jgi:transposase
VAELNFSGGESTVREYIRQHRPKVHSLFIPLAYQPGQDAQLDFGEALATMRGRPLQVQLLVVRLCFSKAPFLMAFPHQRQEALFEGHMEAFAFFGGVPRELLFDQMASVITQDLRDQGERLIENAEFLRFSAHWGFRIRACRPYRAKTKGKVERPVRYVRENLVYGREFLGDADLAAQTEAWRDETANVRIHGTTRERPIERFVRDERDLLQPLAPRPYRSLILVASHPSLPGVRPGPRVEVERRPLNTYAAIAAAGGA